MVWSGAGDDTKAFYIFHDAVTAATHEVLGEASGGRADRASQGAGTSPCSWSSGSTATFTTASRRRNGNAFSRQHREVVPGQGERALPGCGASLGAFVRCLHPAAPNIEAVTEVFLPVRFADDVFEEGTRLGPNVPVRAAVNLDPQLFVGVETGFLEPSFGEDDEPMAIPLGAVLGYSFVSGPRVIDVTANFAWDTSC